MSKDYIGVKYYSPDDMSISGEFKRAKHILDTFDAREIINDINRVIELYNIYEIIKSNGIKEEYTREYEQTAKDMLKTVASYFSKICDANLASQYSSTCTLYIDDFWKIFDKFKLYERISDSAFLSVINTPKATIYYVLRYKEIVKRYDIVLADFLRQSDQCARIIIGKFLEKRRDIIGGACHIPTSLKSSEFEAILDTFIDTENSNINYIQLISNSQSSKECPISDKLRLKAKLRVEEFWKKESASRITSVIGIGVRFDDITSFCYAEKTGPFEHTYVYDLKWIKENLDYPTLLNNFIYLFGYVDHQFRCSFTSKKNKIGVFERVLGMKGVKEYEKGMSFDIINMKVSADMYAYSKLLYDLDIRIEEVFQWFFTDYLKDEFGVDGFSVHMPSEGCTVLEKCRIVPSEMDGVLKQYCLYVENKRIDRALLEISSNQIVFDSLPSMTINKYAYANSSLLKHEMFLMFSDQSLLSYIPRIGDTYNSLFELLQNEEIYVSDYSGGMLADINWLNERTLIIIDESGLIKLNKDRALVLKDLFDNDVICPPYYKSRQIVDKMITDGDLRCESSLLSEPEQDYLNYMLNKAKFSNGHDLRNKYIHSSYPLEEDKQQKDYTEMLKIMALIIIKINEEFCLSFPEE